MATMESCTGFHSRARVGSPAPDFRMKTTKDLKTLGATASLADYRGKWLVMFFYPADFTFV